MDNYWGPHKFSIERFHCSIVLTILPCTVGDCTAVSDATRGTRCIEIHPLGQHMAAGDRQGNLKYKKNYFRTL